MAGGWHLWRGVNQRFYCSWNHWSSKTTLRLFQRQRSNKQTWTLNEAFHSWAGHAVNVVVFAAMLPAVQCVLWLVPSEWQDGSLTTPWTLYSRRKWGKMAHRRNLERTSNFANHWKNTASMQNPSWIVSAFNSATCFLTGNRIVLLFQIDCETTNACFYRGWRLELAGVLRRRRAEKRGIRHEIHRECCNFSGKILLRKFVRRHVAEIASKQCELPVTCPLLWIVFSLRFQVKCNLVLVLNTTASMFRLRLILMMALLGWQRWRCVRLFLTCWLLRRQTMRCKMKWVHNTSIRQLEKEFWTNETETMSPLLCGNPVCSLSVRDAHWWEKWEGKQTFFDTMFKEYNVTHNCSGVGAWSFVIFRGTPAPSLTNDEFMSKMDGLYPYLCCCSYLSCWGLTALSWYRNCFSTERSWSRPHWNQQQKLLLPSHFSVSAGGALSDGISSSPQGVYPLAF